MDTKNFGLYKNDILFFTTGGTFAADAWIASGGQNCGDVVGTRFDAFTADDGKEYNLGRHNVFPVSAEQLEKLLPRAHPAFRIIVEFSQKKPKKYFKWKQFLILGGISYLFEEGHSEQEIREWIEENYF